MPTVSKSAIVASPCERVFALVDAVERYPEFLPWCAAAEVESRDERVTRARLHIDFRGVKARIATENRKRPPSSMTLDFLEGPFERFHGEWRFRPLGAGGCKVEFTLDYRFSSRALEALLGALFGHIAETLVQSFVERAESDAGGPA